MNRPLDPSERIVWNRVARTVTPRRRPHGKGAAKPRLNPTREDFGAMMRLPPLSPRSDKPVAGPVPQSADRLVRRGRVGIDARLDLHGMTQAEALRSLSTALFRSAKRGERCLLVITGKGLQGEGVLRQQLPSWLARPDLRPLIATYAQAHARHGGSGAWYIFLRSS
ncbi:Smr/MutS family protein [Algimonas porphyrae]|uniref:DNA mismatch repair protein MutS n=1 Tax=Algimonas porphyrae TaxID=1128113 RepID=A0ABQ5V0T1_9PROT|nr:Smr/MutS family protein [Algimonas porphyrae]GLQ20620.1 DNA mismatch repair protein MutS [Algimonas porphyrae]